MKMAKYLIDPNRSTDTCHGRQIVNNEFMLMCWKLLSWGRILKRCLSKNLQNLSSLTKKFHCWIHKMSFPCWCFHCLVELMSLGCWVSSCTSKIHCSLKLSSIALWIANFQRCCFRSRLSIVVKKIQSFP